MNIFFSEAAEADIENILAYYEDEAGIEVSQMIESRIFSQIERLASFSERIRQSERVAGARELVFRGLPYIAFVKVHHEKNTLEVLNVVHMARRFP